MKKLFPFLVLIVLISQAPAQTTWSVRFSNAILNRYKPTINALTNKGWEYSNSIVLRGIEKTYQATGDTNYLNYIKAYIDTYVDNTGKISAINLSPTLDKIHPALLCLFLYEKTGLTKYKTAATQIRNYLLTSGNFKTTPDGGYWHKNDNTHAYDNVMMLDGIYMAHTFLAKYGAMFTDNVAIDTAVDQALLIASHVYDNTKKLPYHAWDYSKSKSWANPATGISSEVWSRGLGWYVAALVDILEYLPASHPKYDQLKNLLNDLAAGIKDNQDSATGLWYQVINKQDSAGNYLETSGSGLIIYALKTAVSNGFIDTSYLSVAEKGWAGLQNEVGTYTDGLPQIRSFAPAMSVQDNYLEYTSAPYLPVNCPTATGTQHPHGYCGFLLAASSMEYPVNVYTFVGNGYWSDSTNWNNKIKPPAILPPGNEVIINPANGGVCTLNTSQVVYRSSSVIVNNGKTFSVNSNLVLLK
ncbi:glycoside hydrolase family 88/105 protein [Ferruginibacter albus]|uniref:glycoside hydrolase family 88/105 protein n=1 Tax=Ferruginibacter albus TaxID=2875540 RepID=UPI001CC57894|nr:glycoside hydrolase family 88 protein [Ferruginibacter albus]UAY50875.1 glycoside hydrolase family 88 protein [Ferruginibacter albus]